MCFVLYFEQFCKNDPINHKLSRLPKIPPKIFVEVKCLIIVHHQPIIVIIISYSASFSIITHTQVLIWSMSHFLYISFIFSHFHFLREIAMATVYKLY